MFQQRFFSLRTHRSARPSINPQRAAWRAIATVVCLLAVYVPASAEQTSLTTDAVSPAGSEAAEPAALVPTTEGCDGDAETFSSDEFLQRSFALGLDPARVEMSAESSGSVPNCPIQSCQCSSCQKPIFCEVGACQNQDTGLESCSVGNIAIICQGGETVHLRNAPCTLPPGRSCPFSFCGSATLSGSCQ